MKAQVIEMDINLIRDIIIKKTSAYLIILFGSAATGRMRDDSDIDIAFLSDKKLTEYEVFCIAQELGDAMKRDIDLIDLDRASTVFKANIQGTGRIIYSADESRKQEFQIRTFKEYCLLNEERKEILDRIRERGTVYAE